MIGKPITIDGELKNQFVETDVRFGNTYKVYIEQVWITVLAVLNMLLPCRRVEHWLVLMGGCYQCSSGFVDSFGMMGSRRHGSWQVDMWIAGVYSQLISNICTDAFSAEKVNAKRHSHLEKHFRFWSTTPAGFMGRQVSHISLEITLQSVTPTR